MPAKIKNPRSIRERRATCEQIEQSRGRVTKRRVPAQQCPTDSSGAERISAAKARSTKDFASKSKIARRP
jgi:hypothetical protein